MLRAITNSWALLLGMFFLMVGNGLAGTVLGVRGETEGFSGTTLGLVMSAYFIGFLGGAQATPALLRRVGHVRVFAALASLVSAAFILFAALVDPIAWFLLRMLVGFCFAGVYICAESWLNDGATNETRGQTLSAYVSVQMIGIISAQGLLNAGDPGDYDLFVVMSVLVSVSFMPILLSSSPVPTFEATRRMGMRELFETSPLGCVSIFLLGVVFACQFGMGAVYAANIGLSNLEISFFVGMIYMGGLVCQPPIGWISDRMDRRLLITILTLTGAAGALIVPLLGPSLPVLGVAAFVLGGMSNPLYSLVIAYVNDYLDHDAMPGAAAGLILLNGIGAMGAPFAVGYLMDTVGSNAFFAMMGSSFAAIAGYALWRMTQRPAIGVADTGPMVPMSMTQGAVAADAAVEVAIEAAQDDEDEAGAPRAA